MRLILAELLTELEHLNWVVLDELQTYEQARPNLGVNVVAQVHRQVAKLFGEVNQGSVLYYDQLRQTNAAEQTGSLQEALDKLGQLGKQRGEHLRHSTHDLRSYFGCNYQSGPDFK